MKKEEATTYAESFAEKGLVGKGQTLNIDSQGLTLMPLVVKTDTTGSLEVVLNELGKVSRERIAPKIVLSSVGSINENDVKAALTTPGTTIVWFNAKVDSQAALLAERSGITILTFNIIYELTDKVKELLTEREPRIEVEEIESSVKVLKIFSTTKGKQVLGGRVLSGQFRRNAEVKIKRRDAEIGHGRVKELQQGKVAADSVNEGTEFGALIESKIEIAPGDVLEAITRVTK